MVNNVLPAPRRRGGARLVRSRARSGASGAALLGTVILERVIDAVFLLALALAS